MREGLIDESFWKGKRVLVTGHTGFKGSWLSIWLNELGAEVLGVSLKPKSKLDNFCVTNIDSKIKSFYLDIRDFSRLNTLFKEFEPEIVFHLAAQALVGVAYEQPKTTFETNVIGTLNMLEAIKKSNSVKAGVFITSDKCYKNIEQIWGYKENDVLGGDDPYSASKGCAELVINSYIKSYFDKDGPLISSTRAGNVIGGGDWSEYRVVPDCFKALFSRKPILIRSPNATRPWQFVLEPLRGYIMLGERLFSELKNFSSCWNFGPSLKREYTVSDVANEIIKNWRNGKVVIKKNKKFHESSLLQLDSTKARTEIGWKAFLTFEESLRFTTEWYKYLYKDIKRDMYDFSVKQIKEYQEIELSRASSK